MVRITYKCKTCREVIKFEHYKKEEEPNKTIWEKCTSCIKKEKILKEAREVGIVDIDSHPNEKISLDTIKLATELTKKHAPRIYEELEKRRKEQEGKK